MSLFDSLGSVADSVENAENSLPVVGTIKQGINAVLNTLGIGDSDVGYWLKTATNPVKLIQSIGQAIKGYKYTSGDYKLANSMLVKVFGKPDNEKNWDKGAIPDEAVPIAWMYYTLLYGIPIDTIDNIWRLDENRNGTSVQWYRQLKPQYSYITDAQILRAMQLDRLIGDKNVLTMADWGRVPYAGLLPGIHGTSTYYTGDFPPGGYVENGILLDKNPSILDSITDTVTDAVKKPNTIMLVIIIIAALAAIFLIAKRTGK